jgi:endo-1,3(4)-beta-glucanase
MGLLQRLVVTGFLALVLSCSGMSGPPDGGSGGGRGGGSAGGGGGGAGGGGGGGAALDGCLSNHGGCAATATCTDTPAGPRCECGAGYQGDGGTCTLLDACLTANGGCDLTATCQSSPSGVTCTCVPGAPVTVDLDTPFSVDAPPFAAATGQQTPTALWGALTAPYPTNAWWENLVNGAGGTRFDSLPYQLKAEPSWFDVGNAAPVTTASAVSVPEVRQIMFGALEFGAGTSHAVVAHDLFSVTLRYTQGAGTMTAPLVQGMPYVTVAYAGGLRPMLLPGQYAFSTINGASPGVVSGTRFELKLSDGSTWLLYASSPLTFTGTSANLVASSAFTGTLRVANLPAGADAGVLDAHAGRIPLGATLDVSVDCDQATVRFAYLTQDAGTADAGALLLAAMPHHLPRLVSPATTPLTYLTLSGPLTAVEGSTWTMQLPLSPIHWQAPRPIAPAHLAAVRAALAADASYVPDASAVSRDPYFGGKYLAKLARLALVADELGERATAATLRARLAPLVAAWLEHTNPNPLVHDTTWGGVVPSSSAPNDFGQRHYNDHHFHYGYHLYAAAALARADPAFATSHRAALLALVRDLANPSASDPRFPRFRYLDFFRSHSWAAGLTEFPDGQNQESTSEAINAWYGMHLLGLALGDARLSNLGRVLLAMEVDGARTYWQIPASSTVYQRPFKDNRCVGNLFETQATFSTWFGAEPYKVYGIQMLPFTPASEDLLGATWVSDAWPAISAAGAAAGQDWRGFLFMAHATVDREAAWAEVAPLTGFDDGNSRTNALWWVATRP